MNWGLKIAIFYSAFVVFMLTMVYLASSQKFHLVTENYYAKELQHDAHMQAVHNSQDLEQGLEIRYAHDQKELFLGFPEGVSQIGGEIHLYNIVDARLDERISIRLSDDNKQQIDLRELSRGRWKVQVTWKAGEKDFYDVKDLLIL